MKTEKSKRKKKQYDIFTSNKSKNNFVNINLRMSEFTNEKIFMCVY